MLSQVVNIFSGMYTDKAILQLAKEKMDEAHQGIYTLEERAKAGIIYEACMVYLRAKILYTNIEE